MTGAGHVLVVGGGLGGLVAAHLLARSGKQATLVERAPGLGGVNSSFDCDGYTLDWGCHLFGNDADGVTAVLLDLMGHEVVPVTPRVASVMAGKLSPDLEYPDLLSCGKDIAAAALYELIERAAVPADGASPSTLAEWLQGRFGATTASVLDEAFRKMLCVSTSVLAPAARDALPANRVRLVSDRTADLLKQLPALETRLLRTSGADPLRYSKADRSAFPARAFYPASGGMGGFAARARSRLESLGCRVVTGASIVGFDPQRAAVTLADGVRIEADAVVWAAGARALGDLIGVPTAVDSGTHVVSMLLYYFSIPADQAGPYSYIHDFDPSAPAFRLSVPSSYAPHVCPPDRGYVCAEVTTVPDSAAWSDPESITHKVWAQARDRGLIARNCPLALLTVKKVPVTYRLPRPSLPGILSALSARIAELPRLRVLDEWVFSKTNNVRHALERCADLTQ